jgi:hypothetical protein
VPGADYWALHRATQDAPPGSNEYVGAMAALSGGLVKSGSGGSYEITPYRRLYLEQRSGS